MKREEIEAAALKPDPKGRARLVGLEALSPEENARIRAEEAQRRLEALDSGVLSSRSADEVLRDARTRR